MVSNLGGRQVVVAWHLVLPAALILESHPCSSALDLHVLDVHPDSALRADLPEENVAYRLAAVHRVKQIAYLGVGPNKLARDVRQPNTAEADVTDQVAQRVVDFLE